MNLLYLHGFNSSPHSFKARQTGQWLAQQHPAIRFICPLMAPRPDQASAAILEATAGIDWTQTLVMGSSMGGFYATWVADRFDCKGVLINPAVKPWFGREYLLGEQTNFHTGERHEMRQQDIDNFAHYGVATIRRPDNLWVLLQTGDEVLDYRHAEEFYQGCRLTIEQGGDHSFQHFDRYLPDIIRFWKGA